MPRYGGYRRSRLGNYTEEKHNKANTNSTNKQTHNNESGGNVQIPQKIIEILSNINVINYI